MSVVASVIPKVNEVVELGKNEVSYTKALPTAAAAPPTRTKILAVAEMAVVLVTTIEETTAEVDDGTVYTFALEVSAGADCPKTLYATGILCSHIQEG